MAMEESDCPVGRPRSFSDLLVRRETAAAACNVGSSMSWTRGRIEVELVTEQRPFCSGLQTPGHNLQTR
jgi:hypothetical protein